MAVLKPGAVVRNYVLRHEVSKTTWFCSCACGIEKLVSSHHLKDGTSNRCITCANKDRTINSKLNKTDTKTLARFRHRLNKVYGLTEEEYTEMMNDQLGCCPICSKSLDHIEGFSACIDHDHDTGIVRGLLCGICNRAIGLLQDNLSVINNAYVYLGGTRCQC